MSTDSRSLMDSFELIDERSSTTRGARGNWNGSRSAAPGAGSARARDAWYCRTLGEEFGPIPFEELATLAATGQLAPQDVVRCGASDPWVRADSIVGLLPARQSAAATSGASHVLSPQRQAIGTQINASGGLQPSPSTAEPAPSDDEAIVCYFRHLGRDIGPIPFAEVMEMARDGRLSRKDQMRLGRSGGWAEAGSLVGLFPDEEPQQRQDVLPEQTRTNASFDRPTDARPAPRSARAAEAIPERTPRIAATAVAERPTPAPAKSRGMASVPARSFSPPARTFSPPPRSARSGGSFLDSIDFGAWRNPKIAVAFAILAVVGFLWRFPISFGGPNGSAIYKQTAEIWQDVQALQESSGSAAEWQTLRDDWQSTVNQQTAVLSSNASSDRLLTLMLYCNRDCLSTILSDGPAAPAEVFETTASYMEEAQKLAM